MPNPSNFAITGNIGLPGSTTQYPINLKEIMVDLGITMDGVYRESILPSGVYEYMEKYMRSSGGAKDQGYLFKISSKNLNLLFTTVAQYQLNGS